MSIHTLSGSNGLYLSLFHSCIVCYTTNVTDILFIFWSLANIFSNAYVIYLVPTFYLRILWNQISILYNKTFISFKGIRDGTLSRAQILQRLMDDTEECKRARQQFQGCQALMIDEISMISSKVFQDIEYVLREVRGGSHPFCGMQVKHGIFYV